MTPPPIVSGSYRVPAPAPHQRIAWPDGFGTRFTVFVDVEEEFDWAAPLNRDARSTETVVALPAAHRRFADRGIGWTCMVDYPIATDARAVDILAALCEDSRTTIGTQLHGWVNPPFQPGEEAAMGYAGRLPPSLEAAKLDELTAAITRAFGCAPLAFRSGRYGIGPETLPLLASRGYRVDSSVRARYDYSADGGPDFSQVASHAYRTEGLIELPLTTIHIGALRRYGARLDHRLSQVPLVRGGMARAGWLSRIALTPEDMPVADALRAIDAALDEGIRLLCFSFHSPSLVPGNTPYVRTAADLAQFDGWWTAVLDRLERRGVRPASLEQIIDAAGSGPRQMTMHAQTPGRTNR